MNPLDALIGDKHTQAPATADDEPADNRQRIRLAHQSRAGDDATAISTGRRNLDPHDLTMFDRPRHAPLRIRQPIIERHERRRGLALGIDDDEPAHAQFGEHVAVDLAGDDEIAVAVLVPQVQAHLVADSKISDLRTQTRQIALLQSFENGHHTHHFPLSQAERISR